jgi:hypothetical protein
MGALIPLEEADEFGMQVEVEFGGALGVWREEGEELVESGAGHGVGGCALAAHRRMIALRTIFIVEKFRPVSRALEKLFADVVFA